MSEENNQPEITPNEEEEEPEEIEGQLDEEEEETVEEIKEEIKEEIEEEIKEEIKEEEKVDEVVKEEETKVEEEIKEEETKIEEDIKEEDKEEREEEKKEEKEEKEETIEEETKVEETKVEETKEEEKKEEEKEEVKEEEVEEVKECCKCCKCPFGELSKFDIKKWIPEYTPNKGFSIKGGPGISELSLMDIFLWRNFFVSLTLFLTGHVFYFLITRYEYSVVTLLGRIILIKILFGFVATISLRLIKNKVLTKEDLPGFGDMKLTSDIVKPYIESILKSINWFLSFFVDIILCKNIFRTILFGFYIQLLCWFGKMMSGETFLYIIFNKCFITFKLMEWQHSNIIMISKKTHTFVKTQSEQLYEKIPDNYKQQIQKFCSKCCGKKEKVE